MQDWVETFAGVMPLTRAVHLTQLQVRLSHGLLCAWLSQEGASRVHQACLCRLQGIGLKELAAHQSGLKIILNENIWTDSSHRKTLSQKEKPPENTAATDSPHLPHPAPQGVSCLKEDRPSALGNMNSAAILRTPHQEEISTQEGNSPPISISI